MEIMHVISFCSYVKNYGCYDKNRLEILLKMVDPAIILKVFHIFFMKLKTWIDGNMELCTSFHFVHMSRIMFAMATNKLQIFLKIVDPA